MSVSLSVELESELEVLASLRGSRQWLKELPVRAGRWPYLLTLHGVDHVTFVSCVCVYARFVLPRHGQETRVRQAVEAVERWITLSRSPSATRQLRAQQDRLAVVVRDLQRVACLPGHAHPKGGGPVSAQAALCAALATREPREGGRIGSVVLQNPRGPRGPIPGLQPLVDTVLAMQWPVLARLPEAELRPELQVAWDWLCERVDVRPTRTTSELLGAARIAGVLAQRVPAAAWWSEPEREVFKALAEGLVLAPSREVFLGRICGILASGR
jgi:hypothetical protein